MSFYRERVFPRLCHLSLRNRAVAELRREALAGLAGELLEIGFGTGLNLPHYPPAVISVTGLDPNPGMHRLARREPLPAHPPTALFAQGAEDVPFPEGSFDAAVSTFTLCSVAAVEAALAEVLRVLRPGGTLVFVEHGLAPEPRVARWQRRLTPLWRRLADGCHLDRPIDALLAAAGFAVERCERSYLAGAPKVSGALYRGVARKP